jgi:RNA polymerase sigma-70 factor (ECF subfamily)
LESQILEAAPAGLLGMSTATASAGGLHADRELVQRHRIGDPEAFEELYVRFEGMVFNLALRMTGEPDDAADLSQEIFLRIYRHLGKFRGRSSLKTWIYRIAVNCCRSRLKRRPLSRQDPARVSPVGLEEVPDVRRGPEQRALARGASEVLAAALARLPVAFREAVVLRDIEGLSYQEIALATGLRIGTVRSRIARGRDRLRTVIEESDP